MRMRHFSADATNVILSRPDRLGDIIITSSCFKALKERYPQTEFYLLGQEEYEPLFRQNKFLKGFLKIPSAHVPRWSRIRTLRKTFKDISPHAIIHFHPEADVSLAAFLNQIPVRIGYRQAFNQFMLTDRMADCRKEGLKHEAEYNFDLLQFANVPKPESLEYNIHLLPTSLSQLQTKIGWDIQTTPYVVLNPSAHSQIARWPANRFLELAEWIQQKYQVRIVFIASNASDPSILEICESNSLFSSGYFLNLAGKIPLDELAWLLKFAQLHISRTTGTSHLASAMGCFSIVLFGGDLPAHRMARWKPLLNSKEIYKNASKARSFLESAQLYIARCLSEIELKDVQEVVSQKLDEVILKA
jgi:ADP-heptose:LPS heptosyltransferase